MARRSGRPRPRTRSGKRHWIAHPCVSPFPFFFHPCSRSRRHSRTPLQKGQSPPRAARQRGPRRALLHLEGGSPGASGQRRVFRGLPPASLLCSPLVYKVVSAVTSTAGRAGEAARRCRRPGPPSRRAQTAASAGGTSSSRPRPAGGDQKSVLRAWSHKVGQQFKTTKTLPGGGAKMAERRMEVRPGRARDPRLAPRPRAPTSPRSPPPARPPRRRWGGSVR